MELEQVPIHRPRRSEISTRANRRAHWRSCAPALVLSVTNEFTRLSGQEPFHQELHFNRSPARLLEGQSHRSSANGKYMFGIALSSCLTDCRFHSGNQHARKMLP